MHHQYRTLDDLREIISEYEDWMARPTRHFSHPTLYRKRDVAEGDTLLKGVRKKDWFFSEDEQWVLPHDQMGLSFSSKWQHLKGVLKMKEKHNPGCKIHVSWVLNIASLPPNMAFVPDKKKKGHHLLIITEKMTLDKLIKNLKWLADRMSVIKDVRDNL